MGMSLSEALSVALIASAVGVTLLIAPSTFGWNLIKLLLLIYSVNGAIALPSLLRERQEEREAQAAEDWNESRTDRDIHRRL